MRKQIENIKIKMAWDKKKYMKEYNKKNRDRINGYFRRYYQKNKLKHIALSQKWRDEHPEKIAEYAKNYKLKIKSPEEIERRRIYFQKWRAKNKEKVRAYNKRRRERLKQL